MEGKSPIGEKQIFQETNDLRWHGVAGGWKGVGESFWSCNQYGQVLSFKAWKGLRTVAGTGRRGLVGGKAVGTVQNRRRQSGQAGQYKFQAAGS